MADILAGNLGDERLIGASKGIACTTALAITAIPNGVGHLTIMPRNFVTAVVIKYAINPYLFIVRQSGATTFTSISDEAQDGDATGIVFDSFDVIANDHALYIGAPKRFGGVQVNMVDAKVNSAGSNSVLKVNYWKSGSPSTWADISDSDGTIGTNKTFGQDGDVTWTTPTDWEMATLIEIASTPTPLTSDPLLTQAKIMPYNLAQLFWTRWEVDVIFDSEVEVEEFLAMYDTTGKTYPELPSSIVARERRVLKGPFGDGNIELLTDAGTANVVVVGAAVGASARFP